MSENVNARFLNDGAWDEAPYHIAERLRAKLEEKLKPYNKEDLLDNWPLYHGVVATLDARTMCHFLPWYFSHINPAKIQTHDWDSVKLKGVDYYTSSRTHPLTPHFTDSSDAPDKTKRQNQHFLRQDQYETAQDYVEKNPVFKKALFLIYDAACAYIDFVDEACARNHLEGVSAKHVFSILQRARRTLSTDPFIEELMPILAERIAENKGIISPETLSEGISKLFGKRNALESENHHSLSSKCPFQGAVYQFLNSTINLGLEGATAGRRQKGGLVLSALQVIASIEASAPALVLAKAS